MKLFTFLALVALSYGAYATVTHKEIPGHFAVSGSISVDVPMDKTPQAPVTQGTVKKASTPKAKESKAVNATLVHVTPKEFVCGPMHQNWIGGANQDCTWR